MLTRLKVNGFKNLVDVDVSFGPFTCIAGANGVGKSNLFDAILFLSALADKPLMDAALSVRSEGGRAADLRSIFHRVGNDVAREMTLEAEMIIPSEGADDLGQPAKAAITFLRYSVVLRLTDAGIALCSEDLAHIKLGDAKRHLLFPHSKEWRDSVVGGRRTSPFISTEAKDGRPVVRLHQDLGGDYKGGGRPRALVAETLPRTVLSDVNAAENQTAVLARRELQSWRLLQLEPSALRTPDPFTAPRSIAADGAHLAATLARLARLEVNPLLGRVNPRSTQSKGEAEALYARIANRLAELIDGVGSIRVDVDERRELLTLMLREQGGTEHEARSLSDGTLRFLALAILERDSESRGVLCLEEPENGIHPERISSMLRLLEDLAVDSQERVDAENPLRQVIVNSHSPVVAAQVNDDALLLAVPQAVRRNGRPMTVASFRWLPNTWRSRACPEMPPVALGQVVSYLNPTEPAPSANLLRAAGKPERPRRVVDREDLQTWLPFPLPKAS